MKYRFVPSLALALLLVSCTETTATVQQKVDAVVDTVSGAVLDAKNTMQDVTEPLVDAAHRAGERVEEMQEGIGDIKEGMDKLKGQNGD